MFFMSLGSGPLDTMVKGLACEHKVMWTLQTHPKVLSWKIKIEYLVVKGLQVYCKDHMQRGSQLNTISLSSSLCGPFYINSDNKSRVKRFSNVMGSRFCVRLTSLRSTWHKI